MNPAYIFALSIRALEIIFFAFTVLSIFAFMGVIG